VSEHAEMVTFADGTVAPVEDLYPDRPDLQFAALQAGVLPWTKAEFDEAVARRDATWGGSVISIYCDGRPGDQQGHARLAIDEARLDRDGVFAGCGSTRTTVNSDGLFSMTRLPQCPTCGFQPEATAANMKRITEMARATGIDEVSLKALEIVAFRGRSGEDTPARPPR